MSDKTKVFLVSKGEYSNYTVYGVFSTRENAEKWINGCPHYEVEERDFDCFEKQPRIGTQVVMNYITGDVSSVSPMELSDYGFSIHLYPWARSRSESIDWNLDVTVETTDSDRAVKVAAEKRTKLRALYDVPSEKKTYFFDHETLERR